MHPLPFGMVNPDIDVAVHVDGELPCPPVPRRRGR
jgi:hypothetical protein